jgi:hypothetical protein
MRQEQGGEETMRQDLLIHKARHLLDKFLAPMLEAGTHPASVFCPQALRGILFSGSLAVTNFCGWIRDQYSDRFYQVKRLLNYLVSLAGDLTATVQNYRRAVSTYVESDMLCRKAPT